MFIHVYAKLDSKWLIAAFAAGRQSRDPMRSWCYDMFGTPGVRWRDEIDWGEIGFKDHRDLELFVLRWS